MLTREEHIELLQKLVICHSPPGEEREIQSVLRAEFESAGISVYEDDATNIIARIPGDGPKVVVAAHKDEIGMIVNRVESDGRLKVENIGGSFAWKYGEGPVEVIADDGSLVTGILSVGSIHTNTGVLHELQNSRALTWDLTSIFTGQSKEQLAASGVHVGSRAVVAKERKVVKVLGDYVASFAIDDRMGLVSLIAGLKEIVGQGLALPLDLYFVASHGEEVGMIGAMRAANLIKPDIFIALDTSPIVPETPLDLNGQPVIWYKEATYNDKLECDRLLRLAEEMGIGAQPCVFPRAGSDAGRIKAAGLAGRTVCFGFARDNSHGFEIAHIDSMPNVSKLLVEYLKQLS
jgi:putative aminopeptidase FrvX